eukprot:749422-Amphidinium_carterae.1
MIHTEVAVVAIPRPCKNRCAVELVPPLLLKASLTQTQGFQYAFPSRRIVGLRNSTADEAPIQQPDCAMVTVMLLLEL